MRCVPALVTALGVLGAVLVSAEPAHACSCNTRQVDEELRAGNAFAIVTRTDPDGIDATFRVEDALGSDLPATLTGTVDGGISCYAQVAPGQVAALMFERQGPQLDEPFASRGWFLPVCPEAPLGDVLTRKFGQPRATSTEPVVAVAAGDFGGSSLVALDRRGEAVAWDRRPGAGQTVVVCPGARTVVAYSYPAGPKPNEVTVHDAATLALRRTVPLKGGAQVSGLSCADPRGDVVRMSVAFDDDTPEDDADRLEQWTVRGTDIHIDPAPERKRGLATAAGSLLPADGDAGFDRLAPDGTRTELIRFDGPGEIGQWELAPDGVTVAVTLFPEGPEMENPPDAPVVTFDARSGRVLGTWRTSEVPDALTWTPAGQLFVRTVPATATDPRATARTVHILDRTLHERARHPAGSGYLMTVGESAVTYGKSRILAIPATGLPRVLSEVRLAATVDLVGLSDAGFEPGDGDAEPTPSGDGIVRAGSPPPASTDGPALGLLGGAAAAVAAAGVLGLTRRRRG